MSCLVSLAHSGENPLGNKEILIIERAPCSAGKEDLCFQDNGLGREAGEPNLGAGSSFISFLFHLLGVALGPQAQPPKRQRKR